MSHNKQTYFNSILLRYKKQRALNKALHLGLDFLTVNSCYLLICLLVERIWYLPPETRSLLWIILSLNAFFLYRGMIIILDMVLKKDRKTNEGLLLKIGQEYPDVNDKLLNHFQLSFLDNEIARESVRDFSTSYPADFFWGSYRAVPLKKKFRRFLFPFFGFILLAAFSGDALSRFIHMKTHFEPPNIYHIDASPRDTSLYSYDSLTVTVSKSAPENFPIEIYRENELIMRTMEPKIIIPLVKVRNSTLYTVKLKRPNIFYPRKYLDMIDLNIHVMQRPRIESFNISVRSPEYTNIALANYQGNMDKVKLLKGSVISFDICLSEKFGPSYAVQGRDTLQLDIQGKTARLEWRPVENGEIQFMLKNANGINTQSMPSYVIDLEYDRYPELRVIEPKLSEEIILSEQMALPYVLHLQDDFGISDLSVNYLGFSEYSFFNDTVYTKLELPFTQDSRLQTRIGIWEITEFISPGSEIKYYFELSDNDTISGPKTVRSSLYYAKLPTLGDLFDSQNQSQEESMAMLEDELISTADIVEDLEEIRMDLLREGEMDWEDRSALEENLNSLEKIRDDLQEIQSTIDEQKQFMEENKLFSDEIMQSFEQLQDLINELIDDEMFDMLQNIQDKMERNDPSNMEELLEDFNEKAKRFEEGLDRLLEVFKRIQQEQRLEELGQKIKESLKEQQELLENSDKNSSAAMGEEQNKIANETEKWEELGKESADLFDGEDRELYEEFLDKMNETQVSSSMNEASQYYQQGDRQSGQKQSQISEQKLSSLQETYQQMSSQMMQQQKDEIFNAFQRAFQQALYLSHKQEALLEMGSELSDASPLIHQYTSSMMDNMQIAMDINDDLLLLSKMTFLVDKGLGQALGAVIGNLRSGIQHVEEARLSQGQKNFNLAFSNMNKLARILLERSNMVMDEQQGNASGMDFYMQQLQQMAGQQKQLNSGMPQLGPDGTPTSSMMDQLARMAAQQQALRRRIKQIQQGMSESGEGNKMTGDLDRIAKDMEEVINRMRRNQVDRQTIMRQEKIVQRLLDASRSATSRDYKNERESTSGTEILRENPLSLPGDLGDHRSLIDMIRREVRNSELTTQEKREMERYLESLIGNSPEKVNK